MTVRLVTVATENKGYFPVLKHSCRRHGAKLDVLGWKKHWIGFAQKYDWMAEYLETVCSPNDIVCFVDGYDVVMFQPLSKVEEIFLKAAKGRKDRILVASDMPIDNNDVPCIIRIYLKYKFGTCYGKSLNSGTYVGYAFFLLYMIKSIRQSVNKWHAGLDDQFLMTQFCQICDPDVFIIDKTGNFAVVRDWNYNNSVKEFGKDVNGNLTYTSLEKTVTPCFVHAVGKSNMDEILIWFDYNLSGLNRLYLKRFPWLLACSITVLCIFLIVIYNKLRMR